MYMYFFYFELFLYYHVLSANPRSLLQASYMYIMYSDFTDPYAKKIMQATYIHVHVHVYTSPALFFPITELYDHQVSWYLMANACALEPCQCTPGPTCICHPCNRI